jgi:hypothetical protein
MAGRQRCRANSNQRDDATKSYGKADIANPFGTACWTILPGCSQSAISSLIWSLRFFNRVSSRSSQLFAERSIDIATSRSPCSSMSRASLGPRAGNLKPEGPTDSLCRGYDCPCFKRGVFIAIQKLARAVTINWVRITTSFSNELLLPRRHPISPTTAPVANRDCCKWPGTMVNKVLIAGSNG